ncbi:LacI family DNA-binding transcriptional regulator [Thalassotalea euphylliae]|uniref:LacI family DNA-binding transcriptional regulator n=1 Tax=Thalassotalea euphylliae TaxID=1655234 RepID=UPI003637DE87
MATAKRTKIKDVAQSAGVSMMTVSRVLNQDAKVSETTREKVMSAVKALNYRPNVSARRLASTKSFFLGLIYDNPSASYVSKFLLGALKKCRASGYHLVVDEADVDINKTLDSVADLIHITKVDGMILLPPLCDSDSILTMLKEANVPYIRISPDVNINNSPYICMDDYQAAFDVTEALIKQGHTRIGHIIGHPNQGASRMRYQGFLDALRSNKLSVPPEFIEQGFFDFKSGLSAAQKLLALEEPPTAIFASNDDMAAATLTAAHMLSKKVPDDLAIVGFDDAQLAVTVWPHLSTVRQPIQEMAEMAVELLASGQYDDLSKVSKSDFRHVLDFELMERESSKLT